MGTTVSTNQAIIKSISKYIDIELVTTGLGAFVIVLRRK
jgi:hypothetical protein